jgi:hypothetical protein
VIGGVAPNVEAVRVGVPALAELSGKTFTPGPCTPRPSWPAQISSARRQTRTGGNALTERYV